MLSAEAEAVRDFAAVERLWRDLEGRAGPVPLFRTWTWVGCLVEERYDDPWLVVVRRGGVAEAAALFNRRGGTLWLGETGDASRDAPFVEHNGPLLAAGAGEEALRPLFAAAWRIGGVRRLRLGGVAPELAALSGGTVSALQERPSFWIDLERVRRAGSALAHLSANTRAQLRRGLRGFGGEAARLERAEDMAAAEAGLSALVAAHQSWWQGRGKSGAFADPFMLRFHAALVARGLPRGEVALLTLRHPDGRAAAHLYLLVSGGHVAAYQSGLAADPDLLALRPGLVAHALAVAEAARQGHRLYDLLAGEARYKRSLATDRGSLLWVERVRAGSPEAAIGVLRRAVAGLRARLAGGGRW
ncbi:MAG: GNAT family N-acetyltransferase [Acetobacteraceae bacterium]